MWKALIVDDNKTNSELLVDTLDNKAVCTVANSGEEALVIYNRSVEENKPFDFILLDVAMPGLDGLDVLKVIRAKESSRGIQLGYGVPVIMVTAYKEPFMEAFNRGCDDYILKPIDPDKLLSKISEKLSTRK